VSVEVRPLEPGDAGWVRDRLVAVWGATVVARLGELVDASELPGFAAFDAGTAVGLVTYAVRGPECEVVSIDASVRGRGIGTALLAAAVGAARAAGCRRLWLITSNDNLDALRFYQRRGLRLAAVHRDGLVRARALKPSIPEVGNHGIPVRDELELELRLDADVTRRSS
jgi:GNAT superfamily N-acetyltransferase